MEKFTWSKKVIAFVLLLLFSFMSFVPTSAYATSNSAEVVAQESSSNKSGSTLTKVTAQFLNGIGGTEIINPESYSVSAKEQDPKEIEGWIYTDYDEDVDYVYVPKDVPYIVGYPDSTVRPLRWITRAEATAVFYRLYDGDYPKETKTYQEGKTFTDVPEDHWAHDTIVQLYESGIITGEGNKFNPDQPISRAELAALATRFNPDKFSSTTDEAPFKDVEDGAWYQDVVLLAAANEWVSGYPDKTFKPENNVTRTETMAVINRVLQRQITAERLNEVGAKNPYTDIKSSDWYYADAIEATITHQTEDWHIIDYNDGAYNVIIEDYVDQDGNVIADQEVSKGKAIESPRDIPGFKYLGYVKHSTYIYEKGVADPSIEKSSNGEGENGKPLFPGDNVNYTVKVTNSKDATRWIENAVVSDTIPEYLTLVDGSVYVDNQSVDYQVEKTGDENDPTVKLIVPVGQVDIGTTKTVTFACTIDKDAYNKTIKNIATVTGDNIDPKEDEDEGFTVQEGKAYLTIEKQVSKQDVKVGEKLSYNIIVGTDKTSETKAKNVVVTDVIDENLFFEGNLRLNNSPYNDYTYDQESRKLTVNLGNIEVEKFKSITFDVSIEQDAFNANIDNVGVAKADNADKVTDNAPVVVVQEGSAELSIKKEVNDTNLKVGDDLRYTITVKNSKNAETIAHNVVLSDTIPEEMDFTGQVNLNGSNANINYDPNSRLLEVKVGALDPGESAEIVIFGKVRSDAFGKEIKNLARVTADNADPQEDEADVVTIDPGDPDGNTVVKTVNKAVANVGETVTYTITASNGSQATADWEITLTDNLPEGMTFANNVKLNGTTTTLYSYDSESRTITFTPEPIKPGQKIQYEFDVTIDEGSEGKYFTNVAVLHDGDTDTDVPAPPVSVPTPKADPYVTKTHDVDTVGDLDVVTYTVRVTNGANGGVWKNVYLSDVLPQETQLYSGPYINGVHAGNDLVMSGNNAQVYLGDLQPNETKEVVYKVQVNQGTQRTIYVDQGDTATEKQISDNTIWLRNVVTARGDNGEAGATDDKVQVPPVIETTPGETNPPETEASVDAEKLSEKTIVDLGDDPYNVYTIKMYNDTDEVWKNVVVRDELRLERLHLVSNSVKVNGVQVPWGTYGYNIDKDDLKDTLVVNVGDIEPGRTATVEFTVRFENDYAEKPYTNEADVTSDNQDKQHVIAPTVTFNNIGVISGQHEKLFAGYDSGEWWPNVVKGDNSHTKYLSLEEACCVVARSVTANHRGDLLDGKTLDEASAGLSSAWPRDQWYAKPVLFMGAIKCLQNDDIDYSLNTENVDWYNYNGNTPRMVATREQLGRMIKAVGLDTGLVSADFSSTDPSNMTARITFASEMAKILKRDENPDFNNCERPSFSDTQSSLVSEMSIFHSYVLKGENTDGEIWTFSNANKGVPI